MTMPASDAHVSGTAIASDNMLLLYHVDCV